MKKILFLSVMLMSAVCGWAESRLVIEPFSLKPGETVIVPVLLENDEQINMVQFFFRLSDGLSLAGKPTLVADRIGTHDDGFGGEEPNGNTLNFSKTDEGEFRILIVDTEGNNPFTGNSGAIFNLTIKADSDLQPGEYKLSVVEQILGTIDDVSFEAEPYDVAITIDIPNVINSATCDEGEQVHLYNLQGQRVINDNKGVVIRNGKKFIVK